MALCYLGSFHGTATSNVNLIKTFETNEREKNPNSSFCSIKKIAIEAPAGTSLSINNVQLLMPSTGILEFGMNYIAVNSLIFSEDTEVNIIYLY